jgi:hypothetical protein
MRTDVRSRPFNFAAQVLAGGEATLLLTPEKRFRIKGEDDEEPAGLVEPEDDPPRPSIADAPLHPLVLANRARIAALRRERVGNPPPSPSRSRARRSARPWCYSPPRHAAPAGKANSASDCGRISML